MSGWIGWLAVAKGLVDHLNRWDKFSLDVCERPDAHPGIVDTGETNGWIYAHKEELAKLGVEVRWNVDKMMYEVLK
jgi:hypothetical protein